MSRQVEEISFSINEFLDLSKDEFISRLAKRHSLDHNSLDSTQTRAWEKEYDDLKRILPRSRGRVIFEYSIPGLMKAIDVVVLTKGTIFVLEYKAGARQYLRNDIRQALGYALRLKYYHSQSNDNWIIPILVATDAPSKELNFSPSEDDMVYSTVLCNSETLNNAFELVPSKNLDSDSKDWIDNWEHGIYKASPTIIEAACNVWKQNNVTGFSIGESSEETRLNAENYIINTVVPETKNRPRGKNKSICFVTGVSP